MHTPFKPIPRATSQIGSPRLISSFLWPSSTLMNQYDLNIHLMHPFCFLFSYPVMISFCLSFHSFDTIVNYLCTFILLLLLYSMLYIILPPTTLYVASCTYGPFLRTCNTLLCFSLCLHAHSFSMLIKPMILFLYLYAVFWWRIHDGLKWKACNLLHT